MGKSTMTLKWLLLIGGVYFLAISIVSMLRIKVPLLFVYCSLPSYGYEDRMISFLTFGWSVFLFTAALDPVRNRDAVKGVIVTGVAAVLGLHVINTVTDFKSLAPSVNPRVFRLEARGLGIYVGALILCYFLSTKEDEAHERHFRNPQ
jgi:hypothetical protein